jgi:hypothetical protein
MLKEELPAIISIALMAIVFLAAYWQDTRRVRAHLASLDKSTAINMDTSFSFDELSTDEARRHLAQQPSLKQN